ncbi:MAG: thioredoxin family protein [Pseudomonas sp.]
MRRPVRATLLSAACLSAVLALGACNRSEPAADVPTAPTTPPAAQPATGIAWREGDVQDAFAEAAESGKPILLYWGAVWCPPCNRLKATLFKDPDFIARTRQFVAVHLDGDSDGAQAWGERFGIKGYPTIIVLRPDRSEITRLAGDSDIARLTEVLRVAAGRTTTSEQLLQQALHDPGKLGADDWTLLGEYGWSVDANRLVKDQDSSAVLEQLARAAPQPALQRRFALLALASRQRKQDAANLPPEALAANRALLEAVLADPAEVRANRGTLSYSAAGLVRAAATDAAQRERLSAALTKALDAIYADASLPISDRLGTTSADLQLARLARGEDLDADTPLPQALAAKVHQRVAWADQAATTDYERQSTLSTAAGLLDKAGDRAGAERLLQAELKRSKTPYYYMPELADYAEARGDKAAALSWLQQAYQAAEGPATRVQWGVLYVDGLLRLSPDDKAGIEAAAGQVIGELAGQPEGYHQRTRQRFDTLGKSLQAWSRDHHGDEVLARLRQKMQQDCGGGCAGWLG